MDAGNGALLGQHAFAYAFSPSPRSGLHRRILWFLAVGQARTCCILLASQMLMLTVRLVAGGVFPGLTYFAGTSLPRRLAYPRAFCSCCRSAGPERGREPADLKTHASRRYRGHQAGPAITSSCACGVAGVAVLAAFTILFGRFFYLQVIQHQYYDTKAEDNRISIAPLQPNRGLILDRNAWCSPATIRLYAGAHVQQDRGSRGHDRRTCDHRRHPAPGTAGASSA